GSKEKFRSPAAVRSASRLLEFALFGSSKIIPDNLKPMTAIHSLCRATHDFYSLFFSYPSTFFIGRLNYRSVSEGKGDGRLVWSLKRKSAWIAHPRPKSLR